MNIIIVVVLLLLFGVDQSKSVQSDGLQDLFNKFQLENQNVEWKVASHVSNNLDDSQIKKSKNNYLIAEGLPGQPLEVSFKQYSGYVTVNQSSGRNLFFYFVEAEGLNSTSKPLILWLNGGPGCSSLGIGAMSENGPFGVNRNGRSLYSRPHSWNKVANMLYLESPAGVGFSYSNKSSDYHTVSDSVTAQDSYTFLMKWFTSFPQYRATDFYMAGESYAGYYIPELADLILHNKHSQPPHVINLKGIMVGNGVLNLESDKLGMFDYLWTHALISEDTHHGLIKNCMKHGPTNALCIDFQERIRDEMGDVYLYDLNYERCNISDPITEQSGDVVDPCVTNYIIDYLNLREVQRALHANTTMLPYPWGTCSPVLRYNFKDSPTTMFPLYRRIMSEGIKILQYSGDIDAVIPVTSTQYSIAALNLTIKNTWRPWLDDGGKVGGYRVDYHGLTFATVRGAGHEVPKYQPLRAFSLLKWFLHEL